MTDCECNSLQCKQCTPNNWMRLNDLTETNCSFAEAAASQLAQAFCSLELEHKMLVEGLLQLFREGRCEDMEGKLLRAENEIIKYQRPLFSDVPVPSLWVSSDGAGVYVIVHDKKDGDIYYHWYENGKRKNHSKSLFAFETRYSLVRSKSTKELIEMFEEYE